MTCNDIPHFFCVVPCVLKSPLPHRCFRTCSRTHCAKRREHKNEHKSEQWAQRRLRKGPGRSNRKDPGRIARGTPEEDGLGSAPRSRKNEGRAWEGVIQKRAVQGRTVHSRAVHKGRQSTERWSTGSGPGQGSKIPFFFLPSPGVFPAFSNFSQGLLVEPRRPRRPWAPKCQICVSGVILRSRGGPEW